VGRAIVSRGHACRRVVIVFFPMNDAVPRSAHLQQQEIGWARRKLPWFLAPRAQQQGCDRCGALLCCNVPRNYSSLRWSPHMRLESTPSHCSVASSSHNNPGAACRRYTTVVFTGAANDMVSALQVAVAFSRPSTRRSPKPQPTTRDEHSVAFCATNWRPTAARRLGLTRALTVNVYVVPTTMPGGDSASFTAAFCVSVLITLAHERPLTASPNSVPHEQTF
jgi:hypothetical protein